MLVQLVLTLGFALLLSALTVHFRDLRDILSNLMTFWFFATPIIYPYTLMEPPQMRFLNLNPFTHLAITYQEILYFQGPSVDSLPDAGVVGHGGWLLVARRDLDRLLPLRLFRVRPAERYVCGGSVNAIELTHVSKVYRRFGNRRQFATLKSALLSGSLIRDLKPDETFTAVRDVTFTVPTGRTLGVIGRNGSGKSTLLKLVAGITKPTRDISRCAAASPPSSSWGRAFTPRSPGARTSSSTASCSG